MASNKGGNQGLAGVYDISICARGECKVAVERRKMVRAIPVHWYSRNIVCIVSMSGFATRNTNF